MSDAIDTAERLRQLAEQRAMVQASVEHEVMLACRRVGIPYDMDPATLLAVGPDAQLSRRLCSVLRELVLGVRGLNSRITQLQQDLVRVTGTANSMWNTSNVMWRALETRLVEQGIFADRADVEETVREAGEELMKEALENRSTNTADIIQDHVNKMIRENASEFAGTVGEAAAERARKDKE